MSWRATASHYLFLATFVLVFYCLGASFVESFVNYRTWSFIGVGEFQAYHRALGPRIIGTMVIPIAIKSVFVASLLWFRPIAIPRWAVAVALTLEVINWVSTLTIQIPIQRHFHEFGYSQALLDKLIVTDWIRKVTSIASAFLFVWLMHRMMAFPLLRSAKES